MNLEVDVFVSVFARVVLGEGGRGLFFFFFFFLHIFIYGEYTKYMENIRGRGIVIFTVIKGHSLIFIY